MAAQPPSLKWLFFGFKGRIARQSYALAMLFLILPQFIIVYQVALNEGNEGTSSFWALMLMAVGFLALWSTIALTVKRLHDLNVTAWLAILAFIPTISWIFVVILMFIPSKPVENEHGPPPFRMDTSQ